MQKGSVENLQSEKERLKEILDAEFMWSEKDCEAVADYLIASGLGFVVTDREMLSPYPDGDTSIEACPICGSGEYLHNEDGNRNGYCGQCGQAIDWGEDDV